mgnify:FL=1
MRLKNNKSGFTLLEIIIVIIIVGVLASLALPRFLSTVSLAKATEALANMGALKNALDRCRVANTVNQNQYTGCTTTTLDIADPNATVGRKFNYTLVPVPTATGFDIRATLVGGGANDWIHFNFSDAAGLTRTMGAAPGVFANLK